MANYGHGLQFGIELGATSEPEAAVDLTVLAERAGYDVVSFADDSGDGGAEAWTLASWAAARTDRVVLAVTGVLVSTRPPSVLARAAASLDLLSGGRVALGLGSDLAGGLETAGASSATAAGAVVGTAQPIPALTDAVGVIRAMWDTATEQATYPGLYHQVTGAQPGPAVDRETPLWLGGTDPSLVELAAEAADALVLDLDAAGGRPGVAALNTALDAAAARHDRDPREIRRLVRIAGTGAHDGADTGVDTGTQSAAWAKELTELVLEHGVSTFLLRLDGGATDADLLTHFAEQVIPEVRSRVCQALPDGLVPRRIRRADVCARRHPGIDYDAVPHSLAETAVEPGDPAYARVKSTYLRGGRPGLVLRPRSPEEVADALHFARRHPHLPLGVRSGGHGISGRSTNDGGLVIDLGRLNTIEILDEATRLVRIGPGARWRDVATALEPYGWAVTSGDYGGVGVGGLITAGGIGFLSRNHGLTIDKLRSAQMVLADGSLVRASEEENPELFWAVRGAGANFGIVTSVELVADEVDGVGWAQLAFQVHDPAQFLLDFGRVAVAAPRQTTAFLIMGPARSGPLTAQVMAMVDATDPDVIVSQLQPFAQLPTLVQQQVVIAPYAAVMNMFGEQAHQGRGEPVSRSGLLDELTPQFATAAAELLASGAAHWFQLRTLGGATTDVPAEATAFSHRDAVVQVTVMGGNAQRLDRVWAEVRPHLDGLYLSFETDRSPQRLREAFSEPTLQRLRRLKAVLDPHTLFRDNFAITPDPDHETRSA